MKLNTDEASPTPSSAKRHHSLASKDRYKLFALAALLLLAVWSIFTGTLTLKSSTDDPALSTFSFSNPDDFDVLEVAEREKLVKKLWNVYVHGYGGTGNRIRLPRFWEEAFQAAFENLDSDSPAIRDGALSEIARMSLSSLDLLPKDSGAGEAGKTTISRKLKRAISSFRLLLPPEYSPALSCTLLRSPARHQPRHHYSPARHQPSSYGRSETEQGRG